MQTELDKLQALEPLQQQQLERLTKWGQLGTSADVFAFGMLLRDMVGGQEWAVGDGTPSSEWCVHFRLCLCRCVRPLAV